MKIIDADLKRGKILLLPENLDDLWILYNVLSVGDFVYAKTTRERKGGGLRPKKGERVSVTLGLEVKKVHWDRMLNRLRVLGVIREAPEDLEESLGKHHTLNIVVGKPLTIVKEKWFKHQIDQINRACKSKTKPLIVLSMDDEEYCIAIITNRGAETKVEARIKLPGKLEAEKRGEALKAYFKQIYEALKSIWSEIGSPIAIVGPGYLKNVFLNYLKDRNSELVSKVIAVGSVSSSGISGILEALRGRILDKALKELRIAEESSLIQEVLARIGKNSGDVAYGLENVEEAILRGAVEILLITDSLVRESEDAERIKIEELMRRVEEFGGKITIVSEEHEAGKILSSLGGIAALLRYAIY